MRQFRSPRSRQLTSAILAGMILGPYLAAAAPAQAAKKPKEAVVAAQQGPTPALYVMAFQNNTRFQKLDLGRMASRSFTSALMKTGGRTVIPYGRLQEAVASLELESPFDRAERAKIAAKVEADHALYGNISTALVSKGPKSKAFVRILVMLEFVDKGVAKEKTGIQALSVEGNSPTHPDGTDEALMLQEAIDDAARKLAQFANATRAWGATVAGIPVDIASAAGGVPGSPDAGPAPEGVAPLPTVNAKEVSDKIQPPPPVVVDAPGVDRDFGTLRRRSNLFTTKMLRTFIGGVLLLGILWIGGGSGAAFGI